MEVKTKLKIYPEDRRFFTTNLVTSIRSFMESMLKIKAKGT